MKYRNYNQQFRNHSHGFGVFFLCVVFAIFCIFAYNGYTMVSGPTQGTQNRVLNAARGIGLRNPRVTGPAGITTCSKDDAYFASATVTAENINGDTVTAVVCCGPFESLSKGCTVRF